MLSCLTNSFGVQLGSGGVAVSVTHGNECALVCHHSYLLRRRQRDLKNPFQADLVLVVCGGGRAILDLDYILHGP